MSATLVSSNTTIKVNGGGNGSITAGSAISITAAANEYIICSFCADGTSSVRYELGGVAIPITPANTLNTVYVSPGTTLVLRSTSFVSSTIGYNFTRFINTP